MTSALVAGLAAGYGVAIPLGPVGSYLTTISARLPRAAVAGALGIATVDGAYALAALLGGRAAADALRPVLGPLRWVSVAVLAAVAVRVALGARRAAASDANDRPIAPRRIFLTFVGLTAVNPATLVFFAALVIGLREVGDAAAFPPAVFVASLSWQLALVAGGALLGRLAAGPRARQATALAGAAVMAGLALRLALG